MKELSLRPFEDTDIPLFSRWLEQEYIRKWYTDPADWLYEVGHRQDEFCWLYHFIVTLDGVAIGFCQYYDCYAANALEDWYEVTTPGETYSIDYLIGESAYVGKGYGKEIVRQLTEMVRATGAKEIIVNPEAENQPSNHVLLANGFGYEGEKGLYRKRLKDVMNNE
jgi:RimJ/RimL family protein N-acetyltransferase